MYLLSKIINFIVKSYLYIHVSLLAFSGDKSAAKRLSVLLPLGVHDKVLSHVLVPEEEVGISPQAGHQRASQHKVTYN